MTEEGAATVADDFQDRRQASSRCALVVSDELLPADLQQLSQTLHVLTDLLKDEITTQFS